MNTYAVVNACLPDVKKQEESLAGLAQACGIPFDTIKTIRVTGDLRTLDTEQVLNRLMDVCGDADLVLFPFGDLGSHLAVRLSYRLGGTGLTDVLAADRETAVVSRKVYAGNLIGHYQVRRFPLCLTADRSLTAEADFGNDCLDIDDARMDSAKAAACDRIVTESTPDEGLESARFVVAMGQGIRTSMAAAEIQRASEKAGAEIGGSRPLVMNGHLSMDRLIGVSGSVIRPDVCIAAAVSGAPAFFAGIEGSGKIIAINRDAAAPIMGKSDLAVTGDAVTILNALAETIEGKTK